MAERKHEQSDPLKFIGRLYVPAVLVALAVAAFVLLRDSSPAEAQSFAQCLSEKGVVMYGVDTCNYCAEQKELFGDDFLNVTYKNCSFHEEECREKRITYYPAWEKGGDILFGTQSLAKLAQFSGCMPDISP